MRVSKGDLTFTAAMVAGIALLSALLYLHSRERSAGSGKPIGKVFYKREVAMRKLSDRMVWDDVENGSPLYPHDTVMTGNLSDAELVLDSGLKLKLEGNTLVELDLEDSGLNLRLAGGGIKTSGAQATKTMVTTSTGHSVNVTDGAAAIRSEGNKLAVEVNEGRVEVRSKDGKQHTINKNEVLSGGQKTSTALEVLSPREDTTILSASATGQVAAKCSPASQATTVELAHRVDFSTPSTFALNQGAATFQLPPGDWLLRCRGTNAVSRIRHFRIVQAGGYKVYKPASAELPADAKPILRLEFHPPRNVTATHIEVADNPQFANAIFSQTRSETALHIPLPKIGKYYYRLSASADEGRNIVQMPALTAAVTFVERSNKAPLAFASLTPPIFNTAQVASGNAFIAVESTAPYSVQVKKHGEGKPFTSEDKRDGAYRIPKNLAPGKYTVQIAAKGEKASLAFEIRESLQVALTAPANDSRIMLLPAQKETFVTIAWKGSADASRFQVVLAADPAFKKIIQSQNSDGHSLRLAGIAPGHYFVRVLALENGVARAQSEAHRFIVEEKLERVAGLYPAKAQEIDVVKSAGLNLQWQAVAGATAYEVKLYQKRGRSLVLIDRRSTRSRALHIAQSNKMHEGDLIWEVSALHVDNAGRTVQKSEPTRGHVRVTLGPPLPAPEIVPVVEE